jgi:alkanesulfonate monooxygenase SsuD/methylene tetrahydromethanopterin reductase-like flavin-dependent oxidoreductase (luciferase family)
MALCQALALVTRELPFGTSIAPIYARQPLDYAQGAAFIHELSGGRFRFGVGVSHGTTHARLGVEVGKPLADIRAFTESYRRAERTGDKPPLVLATLRQRMIALAGEIADGIVFANGALSHMARSLAALPAAARNEPDFFIANMIPTCIAIDESEAAAVNRRTLSHYVRLPNYRNYWKEAGYLAEMEAIEAAIASGETARIPSLMSDAWLADTTLFGSATKVRDGLDAWRDAGIKTPIVVPSSAAGNQLTAFEELFRAFSD